MRYASVLNIASTAAWCPLEFGTKFDDGLSVEQVTVITCNKSEVRTAGGHWDMQGWCIAALELALKATACS